MPSQRHRDLPLRTSAVCNSLIRSERKKKFRLGAKFFGGDVPK